jgi:hypothetical protein
LSTINPSYLSWKQQDQLIISAILSSLSTEVLHLAVDYQTSHALWMTLATALASPSNSRIMQLHGSFQDLRQNDSTVNAYLQQAKMLFLGIEVKPTSMGILQSQQKYATDIISRAGMSSCKLVDTPSSPSSALTTLSGPVL